MTDEQRLPQAWEGVGRKLAQVGGGLPKASPAVLALRKGVF